MIAMNNRIKTTFAALTAILTVLICSSDVQAQRRPIQIGGPNGIIMGGGMGFKVGGRNGVHFGGGQGARFGPSQFGMQFGGGQGARFGGQNLGMQFGGGQGARFGNQNNPQMQFGAGQGAKIGPVQFGGRLRNNPAQPSIITPTPIKPTDSNQPQPNSTPTAPSIAPENNGPINIRFPETATEPLEYSLNGSQFQFQPGAKINLRNDHRWDLRFASGQGNNVRRYAQLTPGNYVIRQTASGWQLFNEQSITKTNPNQTTPREAKVPAPAKSKSAPSILELDDSKDR